MHSAPRHKSSTQTIVHIGAVQCHGIVFIDAAVAGDVSCKTFLGMALTAPHAAVKSPARGRWKRACLLIGLVLKAGLKLPLRHCHLRFGLKLLLVLPWQFELLLDRLRWAS